MEPGDKTRKRICNFVGADPSELLEQCEGLPREIFSISANSDDNNYCWYKVGDDYVDPVQFPKPYLTLDSKQFKDGKYLFFNRGVIDKKEIPAFFDTNSFSKDDKIAVAEFLVYEIVSSGYESKSVNHDMIATLLAYRKEKYPEYKADIIKVETMAIPETRSDRKVYHLYLAGYEGHWPFIKKTNDRPDFDGRHCPEWYKNAREVKGAVSLDGWELFNNGGDRFLAIPRLETTNGTDGFVGKIDMYKFDLTGKLKNSAYMQGNKDIFRYMPGDVEFAGAEDLGGLVCPTFELDIKEANRPPKVIIQTPNSNTVDGENGNFGTPKNIVRGTLKERPATEEFIEKLRNLGDIAIVERHGGGSMAIRKILVGLHENIMVDSIDACFICDHTGSMTDNLDDIADGLDTVEAEFKASSKQSSLCVIPFADSNFEPTYHLNEGKTIEADIEKAREIVRGLRAGSPQGYEFIADAVHLAIGEIKKSAKPGSVRKIFVITDEKGDIIENGKTRSMDAEDYANLRKEAEAVGAKVFIIFLSDFLGNSSPTENTSSYEAKALKDVFHYFEVNNVNFDSLPIEKRVDLLMELVRNTKLSRALREGAIFELTSTYKNSKFSQKIIDTFFELEEKETPDILGQQNKGTRPSFFDGIARIGGTVEFGRLVAKKNEWFRRAGYIDALYKLDQARAELLLAEVLNAAAKRKKYKELNEFVDTPEAYAIRMSKLPQGIKQNIIQLAINTIDGLRPSRLGIGGENLGFETKSEKATNNNIEASCGKETYIEEECTKNIKVLALDRSEVSGEKLLDILNEMRSEDSGFYSYAFNHLRDIVKALGQKRYKPAIPILLKMFDEFWYYSGKEYMTDNSLDFKVVLKALVEIDGKGLAKRFTQEIKARRAWTGGPGQRSMIDLIIAAAQFRDPELLPILMGMAEDYYFFWDVSIAAAYAIKNGFGLEPNMVSLRLKIRDMLFTKSIHSYSSIKPALKAIIDFDIDGGKEMILEKLDELIGEMKNLEQEFYSKINMNSSVPYSHIDLVKKQLIEILWALEKIGTFDDIQYVMPLLDPVNHEIMPDVFKAARETLIKLQTKDTAY